MNFKLKTLTCCVALVLLGAAATDDSKSDSQQMQGVWEVSEFNMSGSPASAEICKAIHFEFSSDTMKLIGPEHSIGQRSYRIELDASKKPRAMDTFSFDGPFKGKMVPAIYELNGDKLTLCIPNDLATERPMELKAAEGSKLGLFVLKRRTKAQK